MSEALKKEPYIIPLQEDIQTDDYIIKKLVDYGFTISEKRNKKVIHLIEKRYSIEKIREKLLKDIVEEVQKDLKVEYGCIIDDIDIDKFVEHREERYGINNNGTNNWVYERLVELLKN